MTRWIIERGLNQEQGMTTKSHHKNLPNYLIISIIR